MTLYVIGLGFMCFGHYEIGGFILTSSGVIAGGFGVAYPPPPALGKQVATHDNPFASGDRSGGIFCVLSKQRLIPVSNRL